jgi:hypothetical protein
MVRAIITLLVLWIVIAISYCWLLSSSWQAKKKALRGFLLGGVTITLALVFLCLFVKAF